MKTRPLNLKNFLYFLIPLLLLITGFSIVGKTLSKVHQVEIKGMKFQPAELVVQEGDTIVWINLDMVTHDVTENTRKAWTSSPIPVGKSWKMVASKSATYFCTIHPVMKGKIVVK